MANLPERMMLRRGTFYCRIWVPSDVAPIFGRTMVVTSLRTKDPKIARSRLARRSVELEEQFEDLRRRPESDPQPPRAREELLRAKAKEHATAAIENAITDQAEFYEATLAEPGRLWSGELTPLPSPSEHAESFTHYDRLVEEGDLEAVIAYLQRFRLLQRIGMLKQMRATGNLREFVVLAETLHPQLASAQRALFARLLLAEELQGLEGLLSDELGTGRPELTSNSIDRSDIPFNHVAQSQPPTRPSTSLNQLFQRWEEESEPSASTLSTWRGIVKNLAVFLKSKANDVRSINADDIIGWKDQLVKSGKTANTITNGHLACARALFRFAVANKLMDSDPTAGVRVSRKAKAGTKMLSYDNEEVARLLALASASKEPWKRWLPWLAAATGSRIGEVAQLHGSQVLQKEGITVLAIAPTKDGGRLKNDGSERHVPLHPKLIEDGFLDFVEARGDGPLFYQRTSGDPKRKHASKGLSNRLAAWIRENGFTDSRKAPNHALRHWFKSEASRIGIPDSVADAIQGHSDGRDSSKYRHISLEQKSSAIRTIILPPVK